MARQWLRDNRIHPASLPRDLTAAQWASMFELSG
jgi:hypothetical protein